MYHGVLRMQVMVCVRIVHLDMNRSAFETEPDESIVGIGGPSQDNDAFGEVSFLVDWVLFPTGRWTFVIQPERLPEPQVMPQTLGRRLDDFSVF